MKQFRKRYQLVKLKWTVATTSRNLIYVIQTVTRVFLYIKTNLRVLLEQNLGVLTPARSELEFGNFTQSRQEVWGRVRKFSSKTQNSGSDFWSQKLAFLIPTSRGIVMGLVSWCCWWSMMSRLSVRRLSCGNIMSADRDHDGSRSRLACEGQFTPVHCNSCRYTAIHVGSRRFTMNTRDHYLLSKYNWILSDMDTHNYEI